jgi:signal transduction histidine kinase/DNA-binding response OmpR family regulator
VSEQFDRKLQAAIAVLTVLVFLIDLAVPLGTAVWILYLLPVVASYLAVNPVLPVVTAAASALAIIVGFLFDRAGIDPNVAGTNRAMGIVVIAILGAAGFYFVRNRASLRQSGWLQQGQVAVARASEGEVDIGVMGERVLGVLAERVNARAAVFYAREGKDFRRVAGYGLPANSGAPEVFGQGDGHLWRCVAENRMLTLDTLPDEALTFGSALTRGRTAQAILVPVHADGHLNGVLEFGLDATASDDALALLGRIQDPIGIAIRSAKDRKRVRELLEETRRQSEELRAHGEELAASNEELEEQARTLQQSQQRLEQQQSELEEQNAQLESQAEELETQRDELARSQRLLAEQAQRLRTESRYKSEFVANMSHELRTPLNALLIMARLLADNRGGTLTEEQVGWAQTIESSGKDLLALINDILDLSKIEAGKLDLALERVKPRSLADRLIRNFVHQAESKRIELRAEISDDLPEIETDPGRLGQVLRNFLSNAVKFTERGEIVLSARRDGEGIAFAVRDTGIGIKEAEQEVIFEAFRQADGTISRRYGGTGLGLSISRELAGLLGGIITVESTPGRGSTFTLRLPLFAPVDATSSPLVITARAAARPAEPLPETRLPRPVAEAPDDRDSLNPDERKILIVEDDVSFARILVDLAHELGFQCIVAGTAEDGVLAARQYLPDAMVLDVGLPDHSGLSVLDRLKRDTRTRHIPVHMVSVEDYTYEALSQGAISYMMKPVSREKLGQALATIENRLEHRVRTVLIVEDDPVQLKGLKALIGSDEVEVVGAATAAEGLEKVKTQVFDCLVLDMTLPDATGFEFLEALDADHAAAFPPVIVYTARALSEEEELRLRRYSKSIIIKGAKSPERLVDEVTLFLHQVVSDLPERQQKLLTASLNRDARLEGRRILVVEDDIRNVYALTGIFEPHGAQVQIARNGREALEALGRVADSASPSIDLVLMDVMMPEMDGLTATREIRQQARWKDLPIIMLTAKAMADDQEQCLAAGANDYLAKPLDVDKLLSLTRVWMRR